MRRGFRSLLTTPGFSIVVVVILALGIGANTAIFSIVHAVLLRPFPFRDTDRLVRVYQVQRSRPDTVVEVSAPDLVDWRAGVTRFEGLAAYATSSGGFVVEIEGRTERIEGKIVSGNLFELLGTRPILGRLFLPEDDRTGAGLVTVISERLWRNRLGADPNVLGRRIEISGHPHSIVGVLPAAFEYPTGAKLWVPLATAVPASFLENRQVGFLNLIGRLAVGITPDEARTELDAVIDRVTNPPLPESARTRVSLSPLSDTLVGNTRTSLWVLFAAAGLVLLVACANVANLQIVRAVARQREFAICRALGAGHWALVRQSVAESSFLAVAGGGLGVLLASWSVPRVVQWSPLTLFRGETINVAMSALVFATALAVTTAVVFGLVPVWRGLESNLGQALKDGGRGESRHSRLLSGFVVAQVGLALVLSLGAGLLLRSLDRLNSLDTGFAHGGTLTMSVPLLGDKYSEVKVSRDYYRELVGKVGALPGVKAAGGVLIRPLQGPDGYDYPFTIEGRSMEEQKGNPFLNYESVTPDYFRAMGIRLIEGRVFDERDVEDTQAVVIVSEEVARRFWPGDTPIDKRLKWGPPELPAPWLTVVGAVGEARYRDIRQVSLDAYVPFTQSPWTLNHFVVRTSGDPMQLVPVIRQVIKDIDPAVEPLDLATTGQLVLTSMARPRFNTLLLGIFAGLALALGAVGLYGVMSYAVALRTKEIGIRMALGATRFTVLQEALGRGARLTLMGIGLGLALSLAVTRVLSSILFEVSHTDPVSFVAVSVLLTVVALGAAYIPARRAAKVDPLVALRSE